MAESIAFEELEDSPDEKLGPGGFEATRRVKCAWADRLSLAEQFAGSTSRGAANEIIVVPPAAYPHEPYRAAGVDSVTIAPWFKMDASGNLLLSAYTWAQLTVHYTTNPKQGIGGIDGDGNPVLVSEELQPTADYRTVASEGLTWTDGTPLAPGEEPGMLVRGFDWVYTRHKMPSVPGATASLINCVNSTVVTSVSLGLTFAKETLLYHPPTLRRQWFTQGAGAWEIEYRFTYKPSGWNKFYRAKEGIYDEMRKPNDDGTSSVRKLYEPGDFLQLIG